MSNEFKVYDLNEQGKHKVEQVSRLYAELLAIQEGVIPAGRNRSVITGHMQEAHMTFVRALSELKAYRKEEGEE
jgi:hypothetical protein